MCDMYQDFENTLDELGDVSGSEFEIPEHFDDQVVVFLVTWHQAYCRLTLNFSWVISM